MRALASFRGFPFPPLVLVMESNGLDGIRLVPPLVPPLLPVFTSGGGAAVTAIPAVVVVVVVV